MILRC